MMHKRMCRACLAASVVGILCVASGFAQINTITSVSGASNSTIVAPGSIESGMGTGLNATTVSANTSSSGGQLVTLPTTLGSVSLVQLRDALGGTSTPSLYMVSPSQINYVIGQAPTLGRATLTAVSGPSQFTGPVLLSNIAPALYSADASGRGAPVGSVLRVSPSGTVTLDTTFQGATGAFSAKPFGVTGDDRVFLILYGTGIRNRSLNPAKAMIGDTVVPVPYAGAQSVYPGFDQVNIGPLPATLAGKGPIDLILFVDGVPSNTLRIAIQ